MPPRTPTARRLRALGLDRPRAAMFAFPDGGSDVAYDWHRHPHHQLLYAFSGVARVETRDGLWLLPPQRAIWIPAGIPHRTILRGTEVGSIYFDPRRCPWQGTRKPCVFAAPALFRGLAIHVMRWRNLPRRGAERREAETFFAALALLCRDLAARALPYTLPLPAGKSPAVRAAIAHALEHLDAVSMASAARAAGQSERTLRRHFRAESGGTWHAFVLRARLLRAVELLGGGNSNVTETALAVGFSSLSAFGKAFAAFTGERPNAFRKKAVGGGINPLPSAPSRPSAGSSPSTSRRPRPGARR